MVNTNVAFTAREVSAAVPIVATALEPDSVDVLQMAGCTRVLQLAEMMGRGLARRVSGRDAKSHVIGKFGELLIAEASATGTPLVGRTLAEISLPQHVNVNVIGVWERGTFHVAEPHTSIKVNSVLLLAGSRKQLDDYDSLFCIYHANDKPVVILGGGRVGLAAARRLKDSGVDYRIVEKDASAVVDRERTIVGNAADIDVICEAGLMESPAVIVTTHDDDMNIYLSLYCRRLRPDTQIISRCTLERNVETLHRAGADFVLSYASLGASSIFNLLRRGDVLLLAEGLSAFQVPVPRELGGRTLSETDVRRSTKCNIIAIETADGVLANPTADSKLPNDGKLLLIGSADAEQQFLRHYIRE
jgi:Trk K+ transport system NAD-binding subunit